MHMDKKLKIIISELTEQLWLIDFYREEAQKLAKKNSDLIVSDLDDTIFSRYEQIKNEPELQIRRWYEGNKYMINHIGINPMIEKYYFWKEYPKDIVSKLNSKSSLILTAWVIEYQQKKYEVLGLQSFPIRIVWEWKDKILEIIRYVLFELKYIPKNIIIYEDRPQFFLEYRMLIEECLGTKLIIYLVEMNRNDWYKKIELID